MRFGSSSMLFTLFKLLPLLGTYLYLDLLTSMCFSMSNFACFCLGPHLEAFPSNGPAYASLSLKQPKHPCLRAEN